MENTCQVGQLGDEEAEQEGLGDGSDAYGGGFGDSGTLRLRHDLRQPLAVVNLLAEVLAGQADLPPDVRERINDIRAQAEWMRQLLRSAGDDSSPVVVDLADVVGACTSSPPGTAYEVSFAKLDRAAVLVDPVGLERAARNLLDNAARAVADGGRVEVRVWAEDHAAVLEVADSGPGFGHLAPQHGHGLTGVRRFAERFGGAVGFGTSSLGGALVTLRLPIAVGW